MLMFSKNLTEYVSLVKEVTITVIPDFFLDIIVNPEMSFLELMKGISDTYNRGGGNLLGPQIQFVPGGNGGNVAKTLGRLGVNTYFVTTSSKFGKMIIEYFMEDYDVRSIVDVKGDLASSLILEIPSENGKNNVMMCSAGSVVDYSFDKLKSDQLQVLNNSNTIAITNAQNLELENLTANILEKIPRKTMVSLDFSDLTPHKHRIKAFHGEILDNSTRSPNFILGNENEFLILNKETDKTPENAAAALSEVYNSTYFCLHMAKKAEVWKNGECVASENSFSVPILRATGAGDSWHAGFLTGYNLGLPINESTSLGNATAGYQISTGSVGTLEEIYKWSKEAPRY